MMTRKKCVALLCLPIATMIWTIGYAGDVMVRQAPVEQWLDFGVFAACIGFFAGLAATAWWTRLILAHRPGDCAALIADARQVIHDIAWLPLGFTLILSTPLFIVAVAGVIGAYYVLGRMERVERAPPLPHEVETLGH